MTCFFCSIFAKTASWWFKYKSTATGTFRVKNRHTGNLELLPTASADTLVALSGQCEPGLSSGWASTLGAWGIKPKSHCFSTVGQIARCVSQKNCPNYAPPPPSNITQLAQFSWKKKLKLGSQHNLASLRELQGLKEIVNPKMVNLIFYSPIWVSFFWWIQGAILKNADTVAGTHWLP